MVASTLPVQLSVQAIDPYTGNVFPGLTVTFSDSGKGGTFNPSTSVTDETGSASTSYTLPTKAGSYTLTAFAQGYASGFFKETAIAADLTETGVTDPPATVVEGSSFSITDTVQGIGSVVAAASTTRYYSSTTTSKTGAHLLNGSRAVPSLDAGAISSDSKSVTVSAGTAAGTYFLLACADDTLVVPETTESNNCKASAIPDYAFKTLCRKIAIPSNPEKRSSRKMSSWVAHRAERDKLETGEYLGECLLFLMIGMKTTPRNLRGNPSPARNYALRAGSWRNTR